MTVHRTTTQGASQCALFILYITSELKHSREQFLHHYENTFRDKFPVKVLPCSVGFVRTEKFDFLNNQRVKSNLKKK